MDDAVKAAFEANQSQLGAHLTNSAEEYPFAKMLSEAYDVISKYGVGCLIIEHNPEDLEELARYHHGYRRRYFEQLKGYVEIYIHKGTHIVFRNARTGQVRLFSHDC